VSTPLILLFAARNRFEIPQADEVDKIAALVKLVGNNIRTPKAVADELQFDLRQSSYYGEAAEILGLLNRKGGYTLTELGSKLFSSDEKTSSKIIVCALLNYPIIAQIASILQSKLVASVSKSDIESLVSREGEVHGTTIQRRAQTILAWLKWLHQNSHVLAVENDIVKLETQQKII